jgi:succinate dehydrogenase/fumarate reductase cytochrome b subunit
MKRLLALAFLLAAPVLARAASFKEFTDSIVKIVNDAVMPLLYALAFLLFLIGMVRYFFLEQGEEGREKGKQLMLWGIIGLAVMFSVWGIVRVFLTLLPGTST